MQNEIPEQVQRRLGGPWGRIARDVLHGARCLADIERRAKPGEEHLVEKRVREMTRVGLLAISDGVIRLTDKARDQL